MRILLTQMTNARLEAETGLADAADRILSVLSIVSGVLPTSHKPLPSDVAQGGDRDVCVGCVNFVSRLTYTPIRPAQILSLAVRQGAVADGRLLPISRTPSIMSLLSAATRPCGAL